MSTQKRLFLLDAYALIFRGYYAFIKNPRINSKGMDTSAIMGFMNSLMDVIRREKPDHLAVAFDKGGSDYRYEMYQEYESGNTDMKPNMIMLTTIVEAWGATGSKYGAEKAEALLDFAISANQEKNDPTLCPNEISFSCTYIY